MSSRVPYFVPAYRFIANITQAQNAVVTFTATHTYTPGEILSFRVSNAYGMYQMNNLQGRVLSTTNTTVTLDIDSSSFNPFVTPSSTGAYPAMAVPSSSGIVPGSIPTQTNLQDAFDQLPEGN